MDRKLATSRGRPHPYTYTTILYPVAPLMSILRRVIKRVICRWTPLLFLVYVYQVFPVDRLTRQLSFNKSHFHLSISPRSHYTKMNDVLILWKHEILISLTDWKHGEIKTYQFRQWKMPSTHSILFYSGMRYWIYIPREISPIVGQNHMHSFHPYQTYWILPLKIHFWYIVHCQSYAREQYYLSHWSWCTPNY